MTRSKTKNTPHEYQSIPFAVKALQQLLQDFNDENIGLGVRDGDVASEDGVGLHICFGTRLMFNRDSFITGFRMGGLR